MKNLILALILMIPTFPASAADAVTGYWLTENKRGVIHLDECERELCGTVYWIIEGGLEFDEKNPLEDMRKRKICGLKVVHGLEKTGEGVWENGNIYKVDDGDTYSANIKMQKDGTLKVRGYLGVSWLGKTQIWSRVNAADYERCSA